MTLSSSLSEKTFVEASQRHIKKVNQILSGMHKKNYASPCLGLVKVKFFYDGRPHNREDFIANRKVSFYL